MKIAGLVKNSFVDYPQKISAVVFTFGCPFSCWFCHNKHIIGDSKPNLFDEKEVFDFLNKRKGLIDGVVISGGEPTMQEDLQEFILKVKKLGYSIKLDTNGANPHILESLLEKHLLDYVAMDIKCSLENYDKVCGVKVNKNNILKSIKLIMESGIDYEFRTTLIPEIDEEEFSCILKLIKGAKYFYLQKYNAPQNMIISITNSKINAEKYLNMSKNATLNSSLRGFD